MPLQLRTTELYSGRDGTYAEGSRDFVRIWSVQQLDSGPPVTAKIILDSAPNLPKRGDPYIGLYVWDIDEGCTVRSISARPNRSPKIYWVEARYSSRPPSGNMPSEKLDPGGGTGGTGLPPGYSGSGGPNAQGSGTPNTVAQSIDNPVARPAVVRYTTIKTMEIVSKDAIGDAITNSAGVPFDPPLERVKARLGMHVTRNQAYLAPDIYGRFIDSVNSAPWAAGSAGTWKCEDISATRKYEEGIWFWEVSFDFIYNSDKWNPKQVLDAGTFWLDVDDVRHRFKDSFGAPLARGLLDGDGGELPQGDDPVYIDIDEFYDEQNFDELGLF